MAESEEELKSLLMKVKEEIRRVGLKLNIQKMKIMASGPITSWEVDGETVSDFILGGSKITADCDCSYEIKRRLLLGRKPPRTDPKSDNYRADLMAHPTCAPLPSGSCTSALYLSRPTLPCCATPAVLRPLPHWPVSIVMGEAVLLHCLQ